MSSLTIVSEVNQYITMSSLTIAKPTNRGQDFDGENVEKDSLCCYCICLEDNVDSTAKLHLRQPMTD